MFENILIANDFLLHFVVWLTFFLLVSLSLEKLVARFSHEFMPLFDVYD